MGFRNPVALLSLLAVPLAAGAYVLAERRRRRSAVRFAAADMLEALVRRPGWRRWVPPAALLLALLLAGVALGGPTATIRVPRKQATMILTLDVSRSMQATDVRPNRLSAAKASADKLVSSLPKQMRAGLVAFASSAQVIATPTRDRERVREAVQSLRLEDGTAIGEGILASLEALQQTVSGRRTTGDSKRSPAAIVLLSDGATTVGVDSETAAAEAARANIPIYTVAFGTEDATITVQGVRVPVGVDESELRSISEATGGKFFRALDGEALTRIFDSIGSRLGFEKQKTNLAPWFSGAAGLLGLLAVGLSLVWFGRIA